VRLLIGEYVVLHCLLWVTTVGFLSFFDFLARKRLGAGHQGYVNLRVPKFISLAIASATAIATIYALRDGLIAVQTANVLSFPYFAGTSYFIVVFFREIKNAPGGEP
jgi:hypothetical protein